MGTKIKLIIIYSDTPYYFMIAEIIGAVYEFWIYRNGTIHCWFPKQLKLLSWNNGKWM